MTAQGCFVPVVRPPFARRLLPLGVLLLVLAASACGEGEVHRPLAERTDSAGVEIVTSSGEDAPLAWKFEQLFALGGKEEGPESFYQLYPVTVGADRAGRIYVLDFQAHHVVVFDSTGAFVRTLGREGGGPGELKDPGTLSVTSEGMVTIFDYGKAGLIRFAADGARVNRLSRFLGGDTTILAETAAPPPKLVISERCGGGINRPPLFSPEGDLWVARRVPGSAQGPVVDLFNPSGAYLGALPAGTPFPALLLPGGRIGVVEMDENDVQRLAILRVVRNG